MIVIDTLFFFVFSLTALFWWIPVVGLLFVPFYLLRQLRRTVKPLVYGIISLSDNGLHRLEQFRLVTKAARTIERSGKEVYNGIIHQTYQKTVWWTRFELLEQIPQSASVLDIGCGNGYMAQLIATTRHATVTCLDVVDYNQTDLPTVLYDGETIPFANESFDIVILSFVLHHSSVPTILLKEARRVCRNNVLIYEDEAPVAKHFMGKVHEFAYNWLYNMDSPVTYRSPKEWQRIFTQADLVIAQSSSQWQIGALVAPIKKTLFVLTPEKQMVKLSNCLNRHPAKGGGFGGYVDP